MTDLRTVLELATDEIETPDLAPATLAAARRRRTGRRGVAAGLAAAAAIVGVLVVPRMLDTSDPAREPTSPPSSPPPAPTPSTPDVTPSPDESASTQQAWDPRDVDTLPAGAIGSLPAEIEPPESAPALVGSPVDFAVLAFDTDAGLMLLAADGSWRSVPSPASLASADLSRDGTRLAVETETGVDVWDVTTGESTSIPLPDGYVDWDSLTWRWIDDQTLLLDDYEGGWLVDADSGEVKERVGYPSGMSYYWAIDDQGALVESTGFENPPVLTDWAGGSAREVDLAAVGTLGPLAVRGETIATTSYSNRPFSVLVADRRDLTVRAILPLTDPEANYSNGGLSVIGLLDDGTVLLRVTVFLGGRGDFSLRLVAWDPVDASLSVVARTSANPGALTSVAIDTLG